MKIVFLFLMTIFSVQALSYENQKQKLTQKISDLIIFKGSDYLDEPSQTYIYGGDNSREFYYKYIFDYMRVGQIDEMKKRYGFSDLIANEIQSTIDNRITGVVDESGMDYSKMSQNKYILFKLSFGAALKENDIIYFMYLEISFQANINYYCKEERGKVCYNCPEQKCEERIYWTTNTFHSSIIKMIEDEAYYKIFNSLKYNAQFLADSRIQLYITNGNAIFSEDGENAAYVGEFADIAIGPTKYLSSIQNVKFYNLYCSGLYRRKEIDGEFHLFAPYPSYSNFNYVYPGQMVHKFNMIIGNVNPTSTVYTHRKQMKDNQSSYYYYSLILYTNGELALVKKYNYAIKKQGTNKVDEILWTSNTKGKGYTPYKLLLSKDNRLQLFDNNNEIIYHSKEYINIPTIRYSKYYESSTYPNSYNGYEIDHVMYGNDNAFYYFTMGVDDKDYPNLLLDYYYLDKQFRWIKNKKQFSVVKGAAGIDYFARALKMMLSGPGSEKFKVCYYIRYVSRHYKGINKSPIVCDGESTKVTDRDNGEYFTSFIVFITLKTDTNPQ